MKVFNGLGIKWIKDHITNCFSVENVGAGKWNSPWFFTGDIVRRDSIGRKSKYGRDWLVMRCNNYDCPAELLVKLEDLENLFPVSQNE